MQETFKMPICKAIILHARTFQMPICKAIIFHARNIPNAHM